MNWVSVSVHHHGEFVHSPEDKYVGGQVDVIKKFDIDLFSFRDLEDFAKWNNYDYDSSVVYFKKDGHSFKKGVSVLYDDNSVRDMINVCLPYGKIELYVDHVLDGDIDDTQNQDHHLEATTETDIPEEQRDSEEEDKDYEKTDSDPSDSCEDDYRGLVSESEDDELVENRRKMQEYKKNIVSQFLYGSSDGFDSDELRSEASSSEDENRKIGYVGAPIVRERKVNRTFNRNKNKGKSVQWYAGMKFATMNDFKKAVRGYGLKERRAVRFARNEGSQVQVVCEARCPFYIWASKIKDVEAVVVRALLDDHQCTKPYRNKLATAEFLADVYGDKIRKNPCWKLKDMKDVIRSELEIEVPDIKLIRVRKMALEGAAGQIKKQYARVWDFGHQILLNNPNNTLKIRTSRLQEGDPNKFQRLYVCYHALKEGWKLGCRKIIGLDGCFLKTVCGGQLLSAVGRDGNNQMFPVAIAVVESENTESWSWFLELLREDLALGDGYGYTIISDQQKGLENAVKELVPHVEHMFCVRHLYSNFRKRFPKYEIKVAFWNVACATHIVQHNIAMKQLERLSKPAYEYLQRINPKNWCKAYFQTFSKADNVDNNMCESFNAWIITERYLPLLTMMQEIHLKLMTRMRENRDAMLASNMQLCPKIKKRLDFAVTNARECSATYDGIGRYLVKQGSRSITVSLQERSCDCRVWDLTGIPCAHAVACIFDRREQPVDYVADYYKRDMYLLAYSHSLPALKGEDFWEFKYTEEMLPPDLPKKLRGRPKRLRRREDWEGGSRRRTKATEEGTNAERRVQIYLKGRTMHCSICKQAGHMRTKCPLRVVEADDQSGHNEGSGVQRVQEEEVVTNTSAPRPKLPVKRKRRNAPAQETTPTRRSARVASSQEHSASLGEDGAASGILD